jgi:signal transduction histidine kinase
MEETADTQLGFIFTLGIISLLFLAGALITFMVVYQKRVLAEKLKSNNLESEFNQRMVRVTIESQESERKRFAKDLHDEVGLILQALNLTIARIANESDRKQVQELVDEFTETVRRISWDLMPSSLERFGLTEALDELCTRLTERGSTPIKFEKTGKVAALDKSQEILLYRIVQEAINNALKHARASEIKVLLNCAEDVTIRVSDNGIGFTLPHSDHHSPNQYGLGLYNMESRARLLGGTMHFEKNTPSGTDVVIHIPFYGRV